MNNKEEHFEYCDCKYEELDPSTHEGIEMNYIGEISVWQLWQCPECKKIRITNY